MLTASAKTESNYTPVPEGTYLAVCSMLIDLGEQVNETWNSSARKTMIGWELPDVKITIDGEEKPRLITKTYTLSLGKKANLRSDLAAWRGRDFTEEELKAFDLRNIVGTSCFINIIHRQSKNSEKVYANISSIMALPRGVPKGELSGYATVFDLDKDPIEKIDELPDWIAERIKSSETYMDKISKQVTEDIQEKAPEITELTDDLDSELPF